MRDFLIILTLLQVILNVFIYLYLLEDYSNIEQISIRQTNPNTSINNDIVLNTDNINEEKKETELNKK